jgi:glucose dehydrogenase
MDVLDGCSAWSRRFAAGDRRYDVCHTPFPNNVFALDLNEPGKIVWKYEPKQDPNVIPVMCCDTVNRGRRLC